ncbi:MAG: hypothetical protein AAF907_04050 [Planctomycetota bacterium]
MSNRLSQRTLARMDADLTETEAKLAPVVMTMRIIAGGLIGGVLVFGAFVALQTFGTQPAPNEVAAPTISYIGLGLAVLALIAHKPLGTLVAAGAAASNPAAGNAIALYQTRLIVRLALLEGPAFVNLVALMLEQWTPGWLAVGLLLLAMLVEFPSAGSLRRFVESRRQLAALDPDARPPASHQKRR